MLALEQLHDGPGAQIAAADADDHQDVAVLPDLMGGGQNAHVFGGGGPVRQVHPAEKLAALAAALGDGHVGGGQLRFDGKQVRKIHFAPDVGNIDFDHSHPLFLFISNLNVTAIGP